MQIILAEDRTDAWWAAWEAATSAVQRYEARGKAEDLQAARDALKGAKFPNTARLRDRMRRAEAHWAPLRRPQ